MADLSRRDAFSESTTWSALTAHRLLVSLLYGRCLARLGLGARAVALTLLVQGTYSEWVLFFLSYALEDFSEASPSAARGGHDWTMRSRYRAGVAAGWAFAYTGGYVALIHRQEDSTVAWWYVALIAGGVVALGGVAAGRLGRQGLVLGLAVLVVATLLGAMTIGVFLIPAVFAAVVAIALSRRIVVASPR